MRNMTKKIVTLLATVALLVSMVPLTAFASFGSGYSINYYTSGMTMHVDYNDKYTNSASCFRNYRFTVFSESQLNTMAITSTKCYWVDNTPSDGSIICIFDTTDANLAFKAYKKMYIQKMNTNTSPTVVRNVAFVQYEYCEEECIALIYDHNIQRTTGITVNSQVNGTSNNSYSFTITNLTGDTTFNIDTRRMPYNPNTRTYSIDMTETAKTTDKFTRVNVYFDAQGRLCGTYTATNTFPTDFYANAKYIDILTVKNFVKSCSANLVSRFEKRDFTLSTRYVAPEDPTLTYKKKIVKMNYNNGISWEYNYGELYIYISSTEKANLQSSIPQDDHYDDGRLANVAVNRYAYCIMRSVDSSSIYLQMKTATTPIHVYYTETPYVRNGQGILVYPQVIGLYDHEEAFLHPLSYYQRLSPYYGSWFEIPNAYLEKCFRDSYNTLRIVQGTYDDGHDIYASKNTQGNPYAILNM